MGGIAGGQHDIIGDVHQRVDGAHPHFPNAVLHGVGRGFDTDTGHLDADITRTAVGIINVNCKVGSDIGNDGFDGFERKFIKRGNFPGNAVMPPKVGAVGHGLIVNFKNKVFHIERFGQRRSGQRVKSRKIQNFRFRRREKIAEADFLRRANHAVGFDAAKLGVFDDHRLAFTVPAHNGAGFRHGNIHARGKIDAAADNVLHFIIADVHAANAQFVGVGVGKHFDDFTDDHIVKATGELLHPFHFHGVHCQCIGE